MQKQMLQKARDVMKLAYNPYSHYQVGACIRGANGTLYAGCNIENVSYGLTLCAEAAALSAMVSDGETKIAEVVILGSGETICTPCGACRQRLYEFANPEVVVHLGTASAGIGKKMTMEELLPAAFSPEHL